MPTRLTLTHAAGRDRCARRARDQRGVLGPLFGGRVGEYPVGQSGRLGSPAGQRFQGRPRRFGGQSLAHGDQVLVQHLQESAQRFGRQSTPGDHTGRESADRYRTVQRRQRRDLAQADGESSGGTARVAGFSYPDLVDVVTVLQMIAAVVAIIGSASICFAIGMALWAGVPESVASMRLATVPALSSRQLLDVEQLPRQVAVQGETAPGMAGMLMAPLSLQECVWYRVQIWDEHRFSLGSDERSVRNLAFEHTASDMIAVADATGTVHVSSVLLTRSLPGYTGSLVESSWTGEPVHAHDAGSPHSSDLVKLAERGIIMPDALTQQLDRPKTSVWATEAIVRHRKPMVALGTPRRISGDIVLGPASIGQWGTARSNWAELRTRAKAAASDAWRSVLRYAGVGFLMLCVGCVVVSLLGA
jgi:hypothetical protein